MNRINAIGLCATALLLSACAGNSYVSDADWKQGARRSWVVETYAPDHVATTLPACLGNLAPGEYAAHRYIKVRYMHSRLWHESVAELPPGLEAKKGDQLEVWPADCAAGQLARVVKLD